MRDIVDTKVEATILQNPKDAAVVGADVNMRWNGEKQPAKIVTVGNFAFIISNKMLFFYGNLPLHVRLLLFFNRNDPPNGEALQGQNQASVERGLCWSQW